MLNDKLNIAIVLRMIRLFATILVSLLTSLAAFSQFSCGSGTPIFDVNLSNDPNATWVSPDTNRIDTCCGSTAPDKCVGFEVLLHPNAEGIIFDICDGAIPPGAIFYQVNCGSPTPVGEALCLTGVGPHYITFCKPGNNSNKYCITSIAEPAPGPNVAVNDGCSGQLWVEGYDPDSVTWTSVFPGPIGAYDTLLDCTFGCDTVNINGGNNLPDSVLFQVCGPLLGDCDSLYYCDTMKAYFFNTLQAVISPEEPMVCFGSPGTWIYAGATGGSPPYSYSWSTGSTADSIFVGIGTYILEVADTSGCPPSYDTVFVDSFSVPIQANAGIDTAYCNSFWPLQLNGSVQSATGGVWIGGDGTFSPDSFDLNATYDPGPIDSTNGFVDLYLITTGNGGCPPDTDTVSIELHIYNSDVSIITQGTSCNGASDGSAQAIFNSGTSIMEYAWQTNPIQYGDSAGGMSAGTYSVIVTDSLGCDTVIEFTITEPPVLVPSNQGITDATCNGYNDGTALAGASGGTPPYSYSWSSGSSNALATGLGAGSYTVTVTDDNGCQDSLTFVVAEPAGIIINTAPAHVDCHGDNSGAIAAFVFPTGGSYAYSWSNGGSAQLIQNLYAGTYTLTVTYGNNCVDSTSTTITEPDPIILTLIDTNISCFGANDGSIEAQVSGGVGPYIYDWSNMATTPYINGLAPGSYSLIISDNNGCEEVASAQIIEPALLDIDSTVQHISCFGENDGQISTTVTGGIPPYSYQWSTGSTSTSINTLLAGNYTLTVTDSNGCTSIEVYNIIQPPTLWLGLDVKNITCFDGNDGWVATQTIGGTPPYSYNWSTANSGDTAINLSAGVHTITISDANGCTISADTTLVEPDPISIQMSNNQEICLNTSAIIYVSASGGNGGYQYFWNNGLPDTDAHVVSPTVTTNYFVSVTDTFNCPPAVGQVQISVKPVVFGNLSVSAKPTKICEGKTTQITGLYTGDLSNYTLVWNQNFGTQLGTFTVQPEKTTIYKLTVIDECGFERKDSAIVTVNPTPILEFPEALAEGCAPFRYTFDDGVDGIPIATFNWDFGNGVKSNLENPTINFPNPGEYEVTLEATTTQGCPALGDGSGYVNVRPNPTADFEVDPDEVDTDFPLVKTIDKSIDASFYEWQVSDGSYYEGPQVQHSFDSWGEYTIDLRVENAYGCEDTAIRSVYVKPVLRLEGPTAFTPNPNNPGNGFYDPNATNNDVFYLISEFVEEFHLVVYNRWGEVVFESFDPLFGWNGYYKEKLAPMAMYTWRADVVFVDGKELTETGSVTLLR